ncbi:GMC oxidoreductase [Hirsutella rhossiliensis]|uniref:GMC oxidoreductase domain-containing protein n=1 Tax=Hirsutella rhossiliensis TaxID=111463 RepID=A0A9P8SF45_9HYPO|nr:GMC oxidoreductase domain-containing protein [Hirsutella rhossiliensis]KAH0959689.1 GMC oxidoreductase domain-containing protein [Hirsutella rhossiliensis]
MSGDEASTARTRAPSTGPRCPGPIVSKPGLLKLSGIGPGKELRRWGIPVVVDLPGVGTNLQDRGSIAERGAYTTSGLALAILKKSSVAPEIPDVFIAGTAAKFKGYFPGYSREAGADPRYWTWVVLKAHTRNRGGTIQLRSADPRDVPIINFNYFESGTNYAHEADKDAQALVEGLNFARKASNINDTAEFQENWPGREFGSKEAEKQWVKDQAWGHHASCTCPIGADNDPMAVLDSRFRVRGVDGLRVVDASIFPNIPGYFLVLPVYMISEKAADTIHQDSRRRY